MPWRPSTTEHRKGRPKYEMRHRAEGAPKLENRSCVGRMLLWCWNFCRSSGEMLLSPDKVWRSQWNLLSKLVSKMILNPKIFLQCLCFVRHANKHVLGSLGPTERACGNVFTRCSPVGTTMAMQLLWNPSCGSFNNTSSQGNKRFAKKTRGRPQERGREEPMGRLHWQNSYIMYCCS